MPVELLKLASPVYKAVIGSFPAWRDDVEKVALPDAVMPVPITAEPFLKVTVSPSGIPPPDEVTLAVKVTD